MELMHNILYLVSMIFFRKNAMKLMFAMNCFNKFRAMKEMIENKREMVRQEKLSLLNIFTNAVLSGITFIFHTIDSIEHFYYKLQNYVINSPIGRIVKPVLLRIDQAYIQLKSNVKSMILQQIKHIVMENVKQLGPVVGDMMMGNMADTMKARYESSSPKISVDELTDDEDTDDEDTDDEDTDDEDTDDEDTDDEDTDDEDTDDGEVGSPLNKYGLKNLGDQDMMKLMSMMGVMMDTLKHLDKKNS